MVVVVVVVVGLCWLVCSVYGRPSILFAILKMENWCQEIPQTKKIIIMHTHTQEREGREGTAAVGGALGIRREGREQRLCWRRKRDQDICHLRPLLQ